MDPFLEDFWSDVHTTLMVYLSNALQQQLPEGLFSRIAVNEEDEADLRTFRGDTLVAPKWSGETAANDSGVVAPAKPVLYHVLEQENRRRIEIFDMNRDGEVMTVIEILCPKNKSDRRDAYRTKSRLCRKAGVNLVEIDLLRRGEHVVAVPIWKILPHKLTPYIVCASRGRDRTLFSVWHIPLLQHLPAVAIPLRRTDRDAVVDLQPLLNAAYRDGRYDRLIDYRKPLTPPLPPEAQALVEEHVRAVEAERA